MPSASSGGDAIFEKGLLCDLSKLPKVAFAVADPSPCPALGRLLSVLTASGVGAFAIFAFSLSRYLLILVPSG